MKRSYVIAILAALFVICAILTEAIAQRRSSRRQSPTVGQSQTNPVDSSPLKCTQSAVASNEKMTYLVGASTMSKEDRVRIREKWGTLTIPKGETERAKNIRAAALAWRQKQIESATKCFDVWLKANPNAPAEQIKERREMNQQVLDQIKYLDNRIKEEVAQKKYDLRGDGTTDLTEPSIGLVSNQGERCNTCWAFATTAAANYSYRRKFYGYQTGIGGMTYACQDGNLTGITSSGPPPHPSFTGEPGPFVQDLLNCMPIQKAEICNSGWHGTAFDFMVYNLGMPLAYYNGFSKKNARTGKTVTYRRVYRPGTKFSCRPSAGVVKASAWDYVNSPPDKLPTVEQLKTALVEHGPIVAPIFYDECLASYRGGVFNENNNGMVNHVVLLIGWDDEKQAWLVKNSWGEEWGEKGFGWIKYGSNNIGVFAAWIEA